MDGEDEDDDNDDNDDDDIDVTDISSRRRVWWYMDAEYSFRLSGLPGGGYVLLLVAAGILLHCWRGWPDNQKGSGTVRFSPRFLVGAIPAGNGCSFSRTEPPPPFGELGSLKHAFLLGTRGQEDGDGKWVGKRLAVIKSTTRS